MDYREHLNHFVVANPVDDPITTENHLAQVGTTELRDFTAGVRKLLQPPSCSEEAIRYYLGDAG
ncbi:hypothetical protein BH20GEM2_BH20GEM2_17850 [soil metagenome]|jgi:hypothetical protein